MEFGVEIVATQKSWQHGAICNKAEASALRATTEYAQRSREQSEIHILWALS